MTMTMVTGSILKPPQLSVHGLWIDISINKHLKESALMYEGSQFKI